MHGRGPRRQRALAALVLIWCAPPFGATACREPEDPGLRRSVREATIQAEVRSRLLMADELKTLPLRVETHGSTVRLRGTVHDTTQARAVRAIAAAVRGVERVDLDLTVTPLDTTPAPRRPTHRAPRPSRGEDSLPSLDEAG